MSGDGFSILGAAAVIVALSPVIVAGAAVAGTAYGVSRLIDAEARRRERRRREELARQKKIEAEERENQALIRQLRGKYDALTRGYQTQREEADRRMHAALQELKTDLSAGLSATAEQTVRDLQNRAQRRRQEILNRWDAEMRSMTEDYGRQLDKAFVPVRAELERAKLDFQTLKGQMEESEQLRSAAKDMLSQAYAALRTLQIESGEDSSVYADTYNRAADLYSQGSYALAFSMAADLTLHCLDEVRDTLQKREQRQTLVGELEAKFAQISGTVEGLRTTHFVYNGTEYEDDLRRFLPSCFEAFDRRSEQIEKRLENVGSDTELRQLSDEMDEMAQDLDNLIQLSVQKMIGAYLENDSASTLSQALTEQGFQMEGYAYEGDQEGSALHVNYRNAISGERLTVVISPDGNDIRIAAHQFGDGGTQMDPSRQQSIQRVLEQSLGIQMTCQNPGSVSRHVDAANLEQVKRSITA